MKDTDIEKLRSLLPAKNAGKSKSKKKSSLKPKVKITTINSKEIWSNIVFPYKETEYELKARPLLILGSSHLNKVNSPGVLGSVIVLMITSIKRNKSGKIQNRIKGDVELKDWVKEGLSKPSLARTTRIEELGLEFFLPTSKRLGTLSNKDWNEVCTNINNFNPKYSELVQNNTSILLNESYSHLIKLLKLFR